MATDPNDHPQHLDPDHADTRVPEESASARDVPSQVPALAGEPSSPSSPSSDPAGEGADSSAQLAPEVQRPPRLSRSDSAEARRRRQEREDAQDVADADVGHRDPVRRQRRDDDDDAEDGWDDNDATDLREVAAVEDDIEARLRAEREDRKEMAAELAEGEEPEADGEAAEQEAAAREAARRQAEEDARDLRDIERLKERPEDIEDCGPVQGPGAVPVEDAARTIASYVPSKKVAKRLKKYLEDIDSLSGLRTIPMLKLRRRMMADIAHQFPEQRFAVRELRRLAEDIIFGECFPGYLEQKAKLEPIMRMSDFPRRAEWEAALHAAVMARPEMSWLAQWPEGAVKGRPAYASLRGPALISCGLRRQVPHFSESYDFFRQGACDNDFGMAYGYPTLSHFDGARTLVDQGPDYGGLARGMRKCMEEKDPCVLVHIGMAANMELRKLVEKDLKPGEFRMGQHCAIDAQFLQADVQKDRPYDEDEIAELRETHGPKFGYEFIETKDPQHRAGRKRLTIKCLITQRPLVWIYIGGSAAEHQYVEELITLLFKLWPDCPIQTLSADKAYEVRSTYRFLLTRCGVHLIVPRKATNGRRKDEDGNELPYVMHDRESGDHTGGEEGVPYCPVHEGRLMRLKDSNGKELTFRKRAEMLAAGRAAAEKLARAAELGLTGDEMLELRAQADVSFPLPEDQAQGEHDYQLRYECTHEGCDKVANVFPRWDWRIYSKYARAGGSVWHMRRLALENARGGIEATHAEALWSGTGKKDLDRIRKDTDHKVAWLDGMAMLSLILRPLAYLDGSYAEQVERLSRYDFSRGIRADFTEPPRPDGAPQPVDELTRRREHEAYKARAEAPANYVAMLNELEPGRGERETTLDGYTAESRVREGQVPINRRRAVKEHFEDLAQRPTADRDAA